MNLNERQVAILEELRTRKICAVRELNNGIDASIATIHRDLKKLEDSGHISRVHGSVVLNENRKPEHNIDSRLAKNKEKKIEIAKKAVELIEDETSIFLDHSSTCAYLARAIASKSYRHLVLVTNSLLIANELQEKRYIDIVLAGGDLQHSWSATKGPHALDIISRFNFDQTFISCGMFSVERGARTNYSFVAEITKKACESALEVNLLVDSSKFMKAGAFLIRKISSLNRIITDHNIDSKVVDIFKKLDIKFII
jgi:DeoR/GlpR family transcriptional regulator of sugar metabolism